MSGREVLRRRIVAAAAALLKTNGRNAVTTRAVASAVGVQSPTLYRLFADKAALIDAIAQDGYAAHREHTFQPRTDDPLEDFRLAWARHVDFGLKNPALFTLMFGEARFHQTPAAMEGERFLRGFIRRLARAGVLRVTEDHAVEMIQAVGQGVVFRLLSIDPHCRDMSLVDTTREAVMATITLGHPVVARPGAGAAAITLRARLNEVTDLSGAELRLLDEWLARLE